MPSEQATAAALEIEAEILARRLFDDHTQESIAAIIDAAFAPVVAELVSLLRMGRELAEASRDIEAFRFSRREKVDRATADVNRILGQYDEAIAKHGGGQ